MMLIVNARRISFKSVRIVRVYSLLYSQIKVNVNVKMDLFKKGHVSNAVSHVKPAHHQQQTVQVIKLVL